MTRQFLTLRAKLGNKRRTIASASFAIGPGKTARVELTIIRSVANRLASGHTLKARARASATDARGGKAAVSTATVTLTAAANAALSAAR